MKDQQSTSRLYTPSNCLIESLSSRNAICAGTRGELFGFLALYVESILTSIGTQVGSGPTGLIAALSLLLNGVPVRIVERDTAHHAGTRGGGIQPRTLEVEHFLGVFPQIEAIALSNPLMRVYDAKDPHRVAKEAEFLQKVAPTPDFPIVRFALVPVSNSIDLIRADGAEAAGTIPPRGRAAQAYRRARRVGRAGRSAGLAHARCGWCDRRAHPPHSRLHRGDEGNSALCVRDRRRRRSQYVPFLSALSTGNVC